MVRNAPRSLLCASWNVAAVATTLMACHPSLAQNTFLPGQLSGQSAQSDVVPFELQNGLIVVKALVGDGLVGSAILDTGLPISLMTVEMAAKRALKASGTRDVAVMDRTYVAANIPAQSVRINRMLVSNAACGALDLYSRLSASPPADAPTVWIGNTVLAALTVTIDPRSQQIGLRPPGAPLPIGATVVPFELKDGRIWVDVKVNGKKNFSALVDTGSVGTVLPASVAKALALTPAATLPVTHPDGKEGKVCAVDLTDLSMAGLKVTDVQAIYVDERSKDGFDPDLGIIGNDVLLRYRVTIDYLQRKMAFEKIAPVKPETAANVPAKGQPDVLPAGAHTVPQGNTKITPVPVRPNPVPKGN